MKYRITAFLLCVLLSFAVLCACNSNQDNNITQTQPELVPSSALTDVTYTDSSVTTPDEKGADVKNIEGFIPELTSNGEVAKLALTDTPVLLEAVGSYSGRFVEDGSDEAVENICAVIVKNTGDKPVQYATVTLSAESGEVYSFVLSTLPAGTSALVLETGKQAYMEGLSACELSADVTLCDELNVQQDRVKVIFDGELLHLENLTETDFRAVYVRYKNYTAGNLYVGGITYNATFDNVAALSLAEYNAAHFYTGASQVLMVEIIE